MWCPHCRDDVAASYSPDGAGLTCAGCGGSLERSGSSSETARDDAKELLARWARDAGEPTEEEPPVEAAAVPVSREAEIKNDDLDREPVAAPKANDDPFELPGESAVPKPRTHARKWRVDAGHEGPVGPSRADAEPAEPKPEPRRRVRVDAAAAIGGDGDDSFAGPPPHAAFENPRPRRRVDAGHERLATGPHFVPSAPAPVPQPGGALAGKLLAYAGVLGMTAGAAIVIYSYFGGPATLAPTGWMAVTAGQMLLFLGVVSLVSGGLEETSSEIGRRVEHLGDRMVRIESAAEELLRGPHFATRGTETREQAPARRGREDRGYEAEA